MTDTTNTEALAAELEAMVAGFDWPRIKQAAAELRRLLAERDKFASESAQHFVRAREWAERAGQMEAERNELRAKVEEYAGEQLRLKAELCRRVKQKNEANSAVHAMRAECDALRTNAERWEAVRLLARSQRIDGEDWLSLGILPWPRTGQATTPDYADAAIDAAMKG